MSRKVIARTICSSVLTPGALNIFLLLLSLHPLPLLSTYNIVSTSYANTVNVNMFENTHCTNYENDKYVGRISGAYND